MPCKSGLHCAAFAEATENKALGDETGLGAKSQKATEEFVQSNSTLRNAAETGCSMIDGGRSPTCPRGALNLHRAIRVPAPELCRLQGLQKGREVYFPPPPFSLR